MGGRFVGLNGGLNGLLVVLVGRDGMAAAVAVEAVEAVVGGTKMGGLALVPVEIVVAEEAPPLVGSPEEVEPPPFGELPV